MNKEYKKPNVKLHVVMNTTLLEGSSRDIENGGSNTQINAPHTASSKEFRFDSDEENINW